MSSLWLIAVLSSSLFVSTQAESWPLPQQCERSDGCPEVAYEHVNDTLYLVKSNTEIQSNVLHNISANSFGKPVADTCNSIIEYIEQQSTSISGRDQCSGAKSDCQKSKSAIGRLDNYWRNKCIEFNDRLSMLAERGEDADTESISGGKFSNHKSEQSFPEMVVDLSIKTGATPLMGGESMAQCVRGNVKIQYLKQAAGWNEEGGGQTSLASGEFYWLKGNPIQNEAVKLFETCHNVHGSHDGYENIPLGPVCSIGSDIYNMTISDCTTCDVSKDEVPDWRSSVHYKSFTPMMGIDMESPACKSISQNDTDAFKSFIFGSVDNAPKTMFCKKIVDFLGFLKLNGGTLEDAASMERIGAFIPCLFENCGASIYRVMNELSVASPSITVPHWGSTNLESPLSCTPKTSYERDLSDCTRCSIDKGARQCESSEEFVHYQEYTEEWGFTEDMALHESITTETVDSLNECKEKCDTTENCDSFVYIAGVANDLNTNTENTTNTNVSSIILQKIWTNLCHMWTDPEIDPFKQFSGSQNWPEYSLYYRDIVCQAPMKSNEMSAFPKRINTPLNETWPAFAQIDTSNLRYYGYDVVEDQWCPNLYEEYNVENDILEHRLYCGESTEDSPYYERNEVIDVMARDSELNRIMDYAITRKRLDIESKQFVITCSASDKKCNVGLVPSYHLNQVTDTNTATNTSTVTDQSQDQDQSSNTSTVTDTTTATSDYSDISKLFDIRWRDVGGTLDKVHLAATTDGQGDLSKTVFAIALQFKMDIGEAQPVEWCALYYADILGEETESVSTRVLSGFLSKDIETIDHLSIAMTSEKDGIIIATLNDERLWLSDFHGLPINARPDYHGAVILDGYDTRWSKTVIHEGKLSSSGHLLMAVQNKPLEESDDTAEKSPNVIYIIDGDVTIDEQVAVEFGELCTDDCRYEEHDRIVDFAWFEYTEQLVILSLNGDEYIWNLYTPRKTKVPVIDYVPDPQTDIGAFPGMIYSVNSDGIIEYENCESGTYQDLEGQTTCKNCPAGFSQFHTGRTECVACSSGQSTKGAEGMSSCISCSPGKFSVENITGGTPTCTECPVGYFSTLRGSTGCYECDTGNCDTLGQIMPYRRRCSEQTDLWLQDSDHVYSACCGDTRESDYDDYGVFKYNIENWEISDTLYCVKSISNCFVNTSIGLSTPVSLAWQVSQCCPDTDFLKQENDTLYCIWTKEASIDRCHYSIVDPDELEIVINDIVPDTLPQIVYHETDEELGIFENILFFYSDTRQNESSFLRLTDVQVLKYYKIPMEVNASNESAVVEFFHVFADSNEDWSDREIVEEYEWDLNNYQINGRMRKGILKSITSYSDDVYIERAGSILMQNDEEFFIKEINPSDLILDMKGGVESETDPFRFCKYAYDDERVENVYRYNYTVQHAVSYSNGTELSYLEQVSSGQNRTSVTYPFYDGYVDECDVEQCNDWDCEKSCICSNKLNNTQSGCDHNCDCNNMTIAFQSESSMRSSVTECARSCMDHGIYFSYELSTYGVSCFCQGVHTNVTNASSPEREVYRIRFGNHTETWTETSQEDLGPQIYLETAYHYCSTFFPIAGTRKGVPTCTSVSVCPLFQYWPPAPDEDGFVETDPCICGNVDGYAGYCWSIQGELKWISDDLDNLFNLENFEQPSICEIDRLYVAVDHKLSHNETDWWKDSVEKACQCGEEMCSSYGGVEKLGGFDAILASEEIVMKCSSQHNCLYQSIPTSGLQHIEEANKNCTGAKDEACGIIGFGRYHSSMKYQPLFGHYDSNGELGLGMFQCESTDGLYRNLYDHEFEPDLVGDFLSTVEYKPRYCRCGDVVCEYGNYCRTSTKISETTHTYQNANGTNVTYTTTQTDIIGVCSDSIEEGIEMMEDRIEIQACPVVPTTFFSPQEYVVTDLCTCDGQKCRRDEYCTTRGCESCPCGPNEFENEISDGIVFCQTKDNCEPGEAVHSDGGANLNRQCEPCQEGKFAAKYNSKSCSTCLVCRDKNGFEDTRLIKEPCTLVSDTVCASPCPRGTTLKDGECREDCTGKHTNEYTQECVDFCEPGSYFDSEMCTQCPDGKYTDIAGSEECIPHDECDTNLYYWGKRPTKTQAGQCVRRTKCQCAFSPVRHGFNNWTLQIYTPNIDDNFADSICEYKACVSAAQRTSCVTKGQIAELVPQGSVTVVKDLLKCGTADVMDNYDIFADLGGVSRILALISPSNVIDAMLDNTTDSAIRILPTVTNSFSFTVLEQNELAREYSFFMEGTQQEKEQFVNDGSRHVGYTCTDRQYCIICKHNSV